MARSSSSSLLSLVLPVLLCSGDLLLTAANADEIFTSPSGVSFGRSSREPKYKVQFHAPSSPFHPDSSQEAVAMTNKEGRNYMCYLPTVEESKIVRSTAVVQQNSTGIVREAELKPKLKTPDELIDVLKDACIIRNEGWWTYEYCNKQHVRQIHVEDEKVVQEFVLGVFDPEATVAFNRNHSDISLLKDPRSRDASLRYHPHQYTNGTICDLTDQPRETEVRFVCSEPTVIISSVKEISTCKYVVTIQFPMLCKHPMFQQERPMWHTIHCNEMSGDIKEPTGEDDRKGSQVTLITDDSDRYAT